ncbi:hypothetical protein [Actinocorallia longicatena]|uniref:Uncharacterized protein n=1 Tax=Actinocorallia longicatena TaxID=111803 RepID=A0ABP6QDT5_9ACTN
MPIGDDGNGFDLETEVVMELRTAEASRAEELIGRPVSEWLFDPVEEQAYEIGLRGLLGAVEEVNGGHRPTEGEE